MISLSIYPINGNKDTRRRFQYELLEGESALRTLNHLLMISKPLGVEFARKAVIKDSILTYYFYEETKITGHPQ